MEKSLSPVPSPRSRTRVLLAVLYGWADECLGLEEIRRFAVKKMVPEHKQAFWYYWGGLSMFFFAIQLVTGILLLCYYRPGAEAYESVRQLSNEVDFGWLVRSIHSWSANLMLLSVFVHMFSVGLMKAYRNPREFGWWSGLMLLGLTLVFGFSGYLLPMDDLAYFATKVGLEIPASVPVIGPFLVELMRGGPDVNENTVQRFFTLHVVVLPLIFLGLLGFHLYLVQRHGNAVPPSEELKPESERRAIPFFPDFFLKDLSMWLLATNVLLVLSALFPWQLGPQADPLKPAPLGIHPEWYFMGPFQALKALGRWFPGASGEALGLALFAVLGALWAFIPLYDGDKGQSWRARSATCFSFAVLLGLLAMTIWGYVDVNKV